MFSFVIKTAIEVSRHVLDDFLIPTLGLAIDNVVVVIVATRLQILSGRIIKISFYLNFFL